mgnify:CR=1 FL=1
MCGGNSGHNHGSGGDYHSYKSNENRDNYRAEPTNYSPKRETQYSQSHQEDL